MISPTDSALDALDAALRRSVTTHAEMLSGAARRDADGQVAEARRQADALVERARRDGEAIVDALLVQERASLRRTTANTVLVAQSAVVDDLNRRVHAAVLGLRGAAEYSRLFDGLAARARAQLGDEAVVSTDLGDRGGVVAVAGGRRVDYTLSALAGRAVTALGDAVDGLLQ